MAEAEKPPASPAMPRFALGWAALVYAVCTMALAWPALSGKFLLTPISDQYLGGFPVRDFAASMLRETGGFPLWNPYILGGMPYVAAMHGDIFYPTFLLRMLLPTDVAMTWSFVIHFFLCGFFAFVFLRSLRFSFFACLLGGIIYMLGGNIAGLVSPGHDGKLYLSALLPLTLFLLVRLVRDGRLWACGAFAFVIGLAVLTPHPQLLQYLLLVAGAFALFLAFAGVGVEKVPRNAALQRLGLAAVAIVIGGLIGAIQYVPVREYIAWSPRAAGHDWATATSYSMPAEEIINFVVPQFSGILDNYWGRNGIHFHSDYIGFAAFMLAALAFARGGSVAQRRFVWFWTGTFVVALLWALGGSTPFFRIIYEVVPGTKFFRAPSTMLFVVAFSLSVLATMGSERALRGEVTRRYLIGWMLGGTAIALLGIAGGLTNMGLAVVREGAADRVLENMGALRLGSLRMLFFVALTVGVLFLIQSKRVARGVGQALLCAVIAVDLWSIARLYWRFSEPAATLYASNAAIEYIRKHQEVSSTPSFAPVPGRVIAFQSAPSPAGNDPELSGDGLMVHQVRNVLGYHGNELGRYQLLGDKANGWRQIGNPGFWRLMNVRWLLTNAEDLESPSLRKVAGPLTDAAGTPNVTLYEVTEQNPLAWITPIIIKAPDDAVLATVLDPRFDVRRAALFDTSAAVQGQTVEALPDTLGIRVRTTGYAPGHISLELERPAPEGSALIVSENYFPGWTALVDGKPVTTGRADLTLIGVPLPAGGRKVELTFISQPYETGKMITLMALGLSLLMWGAGYFAGRRLRG